MPNNILDPLRNQEGCLGWSEPAYTRTIQVLPTQQQDFLLKCACVRVEQEKIDSKAKISAVPLICQKIYSFVQAEADFCIA